MNFPEQYRTNNPLGIPSFSVPFRSHNLKVIASEDMGWEHVSVSLPNRCPNWEEMCHIKNLFFGEEDLCIQFHPRKKDYVNLHDYCLHIWKPPATVCELLEVAIDDKA